jgi:tetratricopeptide (TPR) repeat protein
MTRIFRALAAVSVALMSVTLFSACSQKQAQEGGGPGGTELSPRYAQESQQLESALKDDPKNTALLIKIGNLYYDWGQEEANAKGQTAQPGDKWVRAVEYYKRALEIQPGDVNVRVDMANLLRFMDKTDEAIAQYRQAIKDDPKHPQARINLILALGSQQKKDYKGAISEYEALLKAIPEQKDNTDLKQEVDAIRQAMKEAKK